MKMETTIFVSNIPLAAFCYFGDFNLITRIVCVFAAFNSFTVRFEFSLISKQFIFFVTNPIDA
jgi:hypothetical protein